MRIFDHIIQAAKSIRNERFYRTERGFAAEFRHQMQIVEENDPIYPIEAIFEMEVQKSTRKHYGVRQRPDLLIHIPLEAGLSENARDNNFVVFGFKRLGNRKSVLSDFDKLDEMFAQLNYEMGVFINVSAYPETYLESYTGVYPERIHEFSIGKQGDEILMRHARIIDGEINISDY